MKKILLFILTITFPSCCEDDKLSLIREDIINSPLRLDGVYVGNPTRSDRNDSFSPSLLFYNNGVVLHLGGSVNDDWDWIEYIEQFCNVKFDHKTALGIWQVNGKNILIDYWFNSLYDIGEVLYQGKIINDSTFVLKYQQTTVCSDEAAYVINDTYRFIKTKCKPDSTNTIIK